MTAALKGITNVDAVGHRVVHGGDRFREAVLIDEVGAAGIAELAELAPLHNPAALAGHGGRAQTAFPTVPQVAAFDTAFHATIPDAAAIYPLPWEWTAALGTPAIRLPRPQRAVRRAAVNRDARASASAGWWSRTWGAAARSRP